MRADGRFSWSSTAIIGLCDVNQTVSITEKFDGVSIDHLKTLPAGVKFITEDGHGVQDNACLLYTSRCV